MSRGEFVVVAVLLGIVVAGSVSAQIAVIESGLEAIASSADSLACHRKLYTFRVTQTGSNGKQCWDTIIAWACWGRCDSNEISDWRFPYKKSAHPVCVHYGRNNVAVELRHCEDGADEDAKRYAYQEADGCRCQLCSSSDTSCEGLRYRPHRSHPDVLGFRASIN